MACLPPLVTRTCAGVDLVVRSRAASSRRSRPSARADHRPACSGGTSGSCRPRRPPRRCSPGSGSRAHRRRSRSPAARRPSGPWPWRPRREWRTRRSRRLGRRPGARWEGLQRSWGPSFQTGNRPGTRVSQTEQTGTGTPADPSIRPGGRSRSIFRRSSVDSAHGHFLFDDGPRNTYTLTSLAFTGRAQPVHTEHSVGCGTLGEHTKGRSSIGRALVSKTSGWGFKSLRPCYTLLRQDVCACTYRQCTAVRLRPGAARPRPGNQVRTSDGRRGLHRHA